MICENCNIKYYIRYGGGRFCSPKCARSFSTKEKRNEINLKVSKKIKDKIANGYVINTHKKESISYIIERNCDICGNKYFTKQYRNHLKSKTCSKKCSIQLRIKTYKENPNKNVGGYRKGSGRGKSGWYKNIWCDSSYELAYVIYNIDKNIPISRNKDYFEYEYQNKIHKYYPDFIVNKQYVEIKGYERENDQVKYKSVNGSLLIYRKKDLKNILDYVINNYGKDYIKLYTNNPYNDLTNTCKVCGNPCKKKSIYCSRECSGKGNRRNRIYKISEDNHRV